MNKWFYYFKETTLLIPWSKRWIDCFLSCQLILHHQWWAQKIIPSKNSMLEEVHSQEDKDFWHQDSTKPRQIQTKFWKIQCYNQEHKTQISNSIFFFFFWIKNYRILSENITELGGVGVACRKNLPSSRLQLIGNGAETSESNLVGGCGDGAELEDRHGTSTAPFMPGTSVAVVADIAFDGLGSGWGFGEPLNQERRPMSASELGVPFLERGSRWFCVRLCRLINK